MICYDHMFSEKSRVLPAHVEALASNLVLVVSVMFSNIVA